MNEMDYKVTVVVFSVFQSIGTLSGQLAGRFVDAFFSLMGGHFPNVGNVRYKLRGQL